MPSNDAEYQRAYQKRYRAEKKAREIVEAAPTANDELKAANEEIARLKRELAEAKTHPDPVTQIVRQAAVAVAAKKARQAMARTPEDLVGTNDYTAIIQSMTQVQRDAILARLPKTKRAGEK